MLEQGAASLLILAILSFPFLQRRYYEIFLKAHQILAIAAIISIIRHLLPTSNLQFQSAIGYLAASLAIFVARFCLMVFRNKKMGRRFTRVLIREAHGLVHMECMDIGAERGAQDESTWCGTRENSVSSSSRPVPDPYSPLSDHIHSLLKFLNYNLEEDQSYMFTISIFFEQELISRPSDYRISIYNHAPDMKRLISKVVSKNFWEPVVRKKHSAVELGDEDQKEDVDESAMLILVSGSGKLRDEIRKHAQPYLAKDVVLKELDFQLE
ncbi:uncharacterized protein JN550_013693 [Neoarthrinium moseri]|uniref:uncharacterized protein n=1 Tax=Neoarthrinium moseri TaxID=1658444 RepID=UPI001FDCCF5B|nr:uncharacterized protein JN550_013693 [Neoarthrinium moseri]KAI1856699.1 hypothetical protein JN550_013693 [Neoarthrinium moseri]